MTLHMARWAAHTHEMAQSVTLLIVSVTENDPKDDGVAEDGGHEDQGEAEGPHNLTHSPWLLLVSTEWREMFYFCYYI